MSPFKHEYLTYTPPAAAGVQESKTYTDGFGWLAVGGVGFLQAESVYKVTATFLPEKGLEGGGGGGGVGLEEQTALKARPEPFGSGKHWPLGN